MRSGRKNLFVEIQRAKKTKSAETNATVRVWETIHTCWCDSASRRGLEVPVEGKVMAMTYIRFDFDYLDVCDVIETDRILHEGNIYSIRGILPELSSKEYISIDAVLERPPS